MTTPTPPRSRFRRVVHLASAVLVCAALVLAGCGSSNSSSNGSGSAGSSSDTTPHIAFAKTKFLIHAGLAFGAFHRYIYKPFRNGGFTPPSQHKAALVKGALAALFAYHEAKIALQDAKASPLLSKLVGPLTSLQDQLNGLTTRLKQGALDATGINAAASTVDSIGAQSARDYKPIRDHPTPQLGG